MKKIKSLSLSIFLFLNKSILAQMFSIGSYPRDLTLSVGGDGSGPSSSKRPPLDLNLPATDPESASPSDPRALEL